MQNLPVKRQRKPEYFMNETHYAEVASLDVPTTYTDITRRRRSDEAI